MTTRQDIAQLIDDMRQAGRRHPFADVRSHLTTISRRSLRTPLSSLSVGDVCTLSDARSGADTAAQVIAVDGGEAVLAPFGAIDGLSPETEVIPRWRPMSFNCGDALIGRLVDGLGEPLEGPPFDPREVEPRFVAPRDINPLDRPLIDKALPTGLRAIDGLLTLGAGQRIGVFGPPGAGKTSLIGALARTVACDVCVLALIGERGREVREFLDRQLGPQFRRRCVVVASTSDRPAMERVNAAHVATAIAEYFRDRGAQVLLLFDSVTRFARALREVGLSAGEPAVRGGYTPSVYAELPRLIERSGPLARGSITGVYTTLVENGGVGDPIAEEVQSLTDGHLWLSAELGQIGHYPAIDALASKSRLMNEIVAPEHRRAADRMRELMAKHRSIELLLQVGEYRRGADALGDESIDKRPAIDAFLRQGEREPAAFAETVQALRALAAGS